MCQLHFMWATLFTIYISQNEVERYITLGKKACHRLTLQLIGPVFMLQRK